MVTFNCIKKKTRQFFLLLFFLLSGCITPMAPLKTGNPETGTPVQGAAPVLVSPRRHQPQANNKLLVITYEEDRYQALIPQFNYLTGSKALSGFNKVFIAANEKTDHGQFRKQEENFGSNLRMVTGRYDNVSILAFAASGNLVRHELISNHRLLAKTRVLVMVDTSTGSPAIYSQSQSRRTNPEAATLPLANLNSKWINIIESSGRMPLPSILLSTQSGNVDRGILPYKISIDKTMLGITIEQILSRKRYGQPYSNTIYLDNALPGPNYPDYRRILEIIYHNSNSENRTGTAIAAATILGRLSISDNGPQEAENYFIKALHLTIGKHQHPAYHEILAALGDLYLQQGDKKNALSAYIRATGTAENGNIEAGGIISMQAANKAARLMLEAGMVERASGFIQQQVLPVINRYDYPYIFAEAVELTTIAALKSKGTAAGTDSDRIAELYEMLLRLRHSVPGLYAKTVVGKADAYLAADLPQDAINTVNSALELISEENKQYANLMERLGDGYLRLSAKSSKLKGLWALRESIAGFEKADRAKDAARVNKKTGILLYWQKSHLQEAAERLNAALAVYESTNPPEAAKLHYYIGKIKKQAVPQKTKAAVSEFRRAVKLADSSNLYHNLALKELGDIFFDIEKKSRKFKLSTAYYQEAAAFFKTRSADLNQALLVRLGRLYRMDIRGDRIFKMNRAINTLQKALKKKGSAALNVELGIAYYQLARGNTATLDRAIYYLENGLKKNSRDTARINAYLGAAHTALGGPVNLNRASRALMVAIQVSENKGEWRTYHLANLYLAQLYTQKLFEKNRKDYGRYRAKLLKGSNWFMKNRLVYEAAMTERTLGLLFVSPVLEDNMTGNVNVMEKFQDGINHFKSALTIFVKNEYPYEHAMTSMEIGLAYQRMDKAKETGPKLSSIAIEYLEDSLTFLSHQAYPERYAEIETALGDLYFSLFIESTAESTSENTAEDADKQNGFFNRSVQAYKGAMKVWSRTSNPYRYANLQNKIGAAYEELKSGDRKANLTNAYKALSSAINVSEIKLHPLFFAIVNNNLKKVEKELEAMQ